MALKGWKRVILNDCYVVDQCNAVQRTFMTLGIEPVADVEPRGGRLDNWIATSSSWTVVGLSQDSPNDPFA
jgi:hypothetical protein